jgi:hypothetical protein
MSSDNSSSQERFTLTITGFRDESALNDTALSLSSVIKNKTREEIVQAFQALPYVVSRSLSWDSALRLKQLLLIIRPGNRKAFGLPSNQPEGPRAIAVFIRKSPLPQSPKRGLPKSPGGYPGRIEKISDSSPPSGIPGFR